MTEEPHTIPSWFIPDGTAILANEREKEQIEEDGELEEPLCPHCGEEYESEEEGYFIHNYRPVDGESWGEWEQRGQMRVKATTVTASVWCNPNGKKEFDLNQ